jgi:hypothetical protein
LQDQSQTNRTAVIAQLRDNSAAIFADKLPDDTLFTESIVSGRAIAALFGDGPLAAAHAPDVFIRPNAGVIYSGSKKKIAEHGGGTPDDTHVRSSSPSQHWERGTWRRRWRPPRWRRPSCARSGSIPASCRLCARSTRRF